MRDVFDLLARALAETDGRWQAFVSTDLAALDASARTQGQGAVIVPRAAP
jgi:hypothetical protein